MPTWCTSWGSRSCSPPRRSQYPPGCSDPAQPPMPPVGKQSINLQFLSIQKAKIVHAICFPFLHILEKLLEDWNMRQFVCFHVKKYCLQFLLKTVTFYKIVKF